MRRHTGERDPQDVRNVAERMDARERPVSSLSNYRPKGGSFATGFRALLTQPTLSCHTRERNPHSVAMPVNATHTQLPYP